MVRRWLYPLALLFLLAAGLLLDIHLQSAPAVELDIGGRDLGFVQGFSSKEWSDLLPTPYGPARETYRWMGAVGTIRLGPVRGGRPLLLSLRLSGGRPADAPPSTAHLRVNGRLRATFSLSPYLSTYTFLLPAGDARGGILRVELETETFRIEHDPRDLGLIAERASVQVLGEGGGGHLPRPTYALLGVAVLLGLWAVGLTFWSAWGVGAGLLFLTALAAVPRPTAVLHAGPTLLLLALLGAVVAGVLYWAGPRWQAWARWLGQHAQVVLLALFLLSLLFAFSPHIEADGVQYYAYLRSLAFDRDLHFANELSLDVPFEHVPYGLGAKRTETGYAPNYASVGPAILWAPFLPLGHLLALAGRAMGFDWTLDGYGEPYVVMICFGSALSALLTLLLGYDLVRRLYGRALGLLATLATFLGSGLFYYAFYKPDFAHALAAAAVTLFLYLWLTTRPARTARQWFWLGLSAGLMTTLYWIDALLVVLPAAEVLWEGLGALRARRWERLRLLLIGGLLFLLAFLLGFAPQMVVWKVLFGSWLTVPQEGFATPSGFVPLELLLSPLHGLLPWTPIVVLGMLGLFLLAWERRPWGLFLLLAPLLYFAYNATLGSWHGGGTFGLRRLVNAYPFFLLGVGALLERLRRWRPAAAFLTALFPTLWGGLVLLRYQVYTIPHYPSELENLSLSEFLFAPDNLPLDRLGDLLDLAFFVRWGKGLLREMRLADLLYGLLLLLLFLAASLGVGCLLQKVAKKEAGSL